MLSHDLVFTFYPKSQNVNTLNSTISTAQGRQWKKVEAKTIRLWTSALKCKQLFILHQKIWKTCKLAT